MSEAGISRASRYFFWIILSSFSAYFAEVVSFSDPFPFFRPQGLLLVMPIYGLHILILWGVIYRFGAPRFPTLFLAGALFGMYEAYITKVLWKPTWGDAILPLGGVAVIEVMGLVLWWHAWMAFIVPLALAEFLLTGSRDVWSGLPGWIRRLLERADPVFAVVVFAAACGVFQSANSPDAGMSLLSGGSSAVLLLLIFAWRRFVRRQGRVPALREMVPTKRELAGLSAALAVVYVACGVFIRPEALPGWEPQFWIWVIYAVLIALFLLSLKKSRGWMPADGASTGQAFPLRYCALFAVLFAFSSAAIAAAPVEGPLMLVYWLAGISAGWVALIAAAVDALRRPQHSANCSS